MKAVKAMIILGAFDEDILLICCAKTFLSQVIKFENISDILEMD